MFPARYFNPRYWAGRFWPKVGADSATQPPEIFEAQASYAATVTRAASYRATVTQRASSRGVIELEAHDG